MCFFYTNDPLEKGMLILFERNLITKWKKAKNHLEAHSCVFLSSRFGWRNFLTVNKCARRKERKKENRMNIRKIDANIFLYLFMFEKFVYEKNKEHIVKECA